MAKTKFGFKIIVFLLLTVILSTSMLVSCQNGGHNDSKTEATEPNEVTTRPTEEKRILKIVENGASKYKIIISVYSSDDVVRAANELCNKIKRLTGVDLTVVYDILVPASEDNFEILVGQTNRSESEQAIEGFRSKDYAVRVIGNKLVINAKTDSVTKGTVDLFIDQIIIPLISASVNTDSWAFSSEQEIIHHSTAYSVRECDIIGVPLENYTIVYPKNGLFSAKRTAVLFSRFVENKVGYVIPVLSDDKCESKNVICFGKTSCGGFDISGEKLGAYEVRAENNGLMLSAADLFGYKMLYKYLTEIMFAASDKLEIKDGFSSTGDGSPEPEAKYAVEKSGEYRVIFNNILGNCDTELYPTAQRNLMAAEMLASLKPDVIGLQECSENSRGSSSVVKELTRLGYTELVVKATNKNGVNYTPVFYNAEKFNVIDKGYHLYNDDANDKSKSITWGVFEDKTNGKRFSVLSTHFYWTSDEKGNNARIKDAEQIIALKNSIASKYACPVISGGDFNCNMSSQPYKNMISAGFKDVQKLSAVSENLKTHHTYPEWDATAGLYLTINKPSGEYDKAIDHIFVYNESGVTFKTFDVITLEYALLSADHCPVLADFDIIK